MTVTCRIYEGGTYTQTDFAEMLASFLQDGYIPGYENELEVTALTPNALGVNLDTGRAHIQGYWYELPSNMPMMLESADLTNPRIDRIILRLETGAPRQVSAKILKGEASASPTAPTLTRNSSIWEISLAQIAVAAGATLITSGNITDERDDSSICGVASVAKTMHSEIPIAATFDCGGRKVINLATPTLDTDAIRKKYFDDNIIGGKYGANKCEIVSYPGTGAIPSGWLECDGSSQLRSAYPDLFAAFGTTFGSADGTHFNLPDLRGKFPYGASSSLGATGGEKTHTLITSEMPAHTHSNVVASDITGLGAYVETPCGSNYTGGTGNSGYTGGGGAHQNLHPYLAMRMIVRAS
jgi:microcystin-dependent protein